MQRIINMDDKITPPVKKQEPYAYTENSISLIQSKKFNYQIINLESPEGHFGRLRSPIILERLIKEAKQNERKLEDVRLQEKAKQL